MKISLISRKGNFIVEKNGNKILDVQYKNWSSSTAKTEFNGQTIEIKPKSFWRSELEILKNNEKIGNIIFKWNGNAIIRVLNDKSEEIVLSLKAKGFWNSDFELRNAERELIFVLTPSFKWRKLNYDFEIENIQNLYNENTIIELLIYSVTVCRRYMINMAGAVGGAAAAAGVAAATV